MKLDTKENIILTIGALIGSIIIMLIIFVPFWEKIKILIVAGILNLVFINILMQSVKPHRRTD